MKIETNILSHDYGYGLNISPNKIKKLFLSNIAELKIYIKDIINTNFGETNNLSFKNINNMITIEKINYKINFLN